MSFEFSDWWLMIFGTHSLISFHLTTGSELRRGHLIGTSGQNPSRPHKPGVVYQVGWRSPELIHWVHPGRRNRSFWFAYNPYQISEFRVCVFVVADTLCPLVRWSVGPSVSTSQKVGKRAYPPLPTRPQLMAVYPALFKISRILCVRIRIWIAFLPLVEWRVCD